MLLQFKNTCLTFRNCLSYFVCVITFLFCYKVTVIINSSLMVLCGKIKVGNAIVYLQMLFDFALGTTVRVCQFTL